MWGNAPCGPHFKDPQSVLPSTQVLANKPIALKVAPNQPETLPAGPSVVLQSETPPMRAAFKTTFALGTALCSLAVLTPNTAGQSGAPCFVAGDALGVELHCAAVMALATPEPDPIEFEAFPVELASATAAAFEPTFIIATARHINMPLAPIDVNNATAEHAAFAWSMLDDLAQWLTPQMPAFANNTVWMAIVN